MRPNFGELRLFNCFFTGELVVGFRLVKSEFLDFGSISHIAPVAVALTFNSVNAALMCIVPLRVPRNGELPHCLTKLRLPALFCVLRQPEVVFAQNLAGEVALQYVLPGVEHRIIPAALYRGKKCPDYVRVIVPEKPGGENILVLKVHCDRVVYLVVPE